MDSRALPGPMISKNEPLGMERRNDAEKRSNDNTVNKKMPENQPFIYLPPPPKRRFSLLA